MKTYRDLTLKTTSIITYLFEQLAAEVCLSQPPDVRQVVSEDLCKLLHKEDPLGTLTRLEAFLPVHLRGAEHGRTPNSGDRLFLSL